MIECPEWVPPRVVLEVQRLDKQTMPKEQRECLRRLATDVRMRPAWQELLKEHRRPAPHGKGGCGYLHPARPVEADATLDPKKRQECQSAPKKDPPSASKRDPLSSVHRPTVSPGAEP